MLLFGWWSDSPPPHGARPGTAGTPGTTDGPAARPGLPAAWPGALQPCLRVGDFLLLGGGTPFPVYFGLLFWTDEGTPIPAESCPKKTLSFFLFLKVFQLRITAAKLSPRTLNCPWYTHSTHWTSPVLLAHMRIMTCCPTNNNQRLILLLLTIWSTEHSIKLYIDSTPVKHTQREKLYVVTITVIYSGMVGCAIKSEVNWIIRHFHSVTQTYLCPKVPVSVQVYKNSDVETQEQCWYSMYCSNVHPCSYKFPDLAIKPQICIISLWYRLFSTFFLFRK